MIDLLRWPARLYTALSTLERRLFETVPFLVERPAARVISIGNLSVGGTGKTPVLIELLRDDALRRQAVVLTRGYRSPWERSFYLLLGPGPHPAELTDEALMLNQIFPDLPILLGKNRAHAARCAEKWFAPRHLILDDGFQYRRLRHDIDLVLWDATMPPEHRFPLPHGRLREPLTRLRAASAVLLTRADLVPAGKLRDQERLLRQHGVTGPILPVTIGPTGWITPDGRLVGLADGPREGVVLTAIARPDVLRLTLERLGCRVANAHCRRDHDAFPLEQLLAIGREAREHHGVPIVTEKDRIKIPPAVVAAQNIWTLVIRPQPADGGTLGEELRRLGLL